MKKYMEHYAITTRIVIAFVALVIIPYMFLAGITYTVFQQYSVSSLGKTTMDTVKAAATNIHIAMNQREDDSMAVYYDECVELLGKEEALDEKEKAQIENVLSSISYSNNGVRAAYIESGQGVFHGGGNYAGIMTIMESHKQEIEDAGGACLWYTTNELYGKADQYNYILARSLNSSEKKNIGILYLVSSEKMIEDNLGQRSTEYAEWYLTDADGNIFFSSDASQTGKMLDVSMLNREEKTSYQETKGSDQKSRIMVAYSLMDVNWFCVSVINTEAAQANVLKLVFPFLIISMIYILFLMVMLYIMQKYVFGPLRRLKHAMDQYALNGLEETKIEVYGEGEFSSLSRHFNNMTVRIKRLVKANQDETEEKNRQKMRALSAQLTPHFIYNALNTIKWVAVLNQQKKIQNLVESLIGIFMNAARADDDSYTLADELNLIENYSVIQKTRFMNFDLVINAEPDSKNCRIRKLLIQPIVENAIVHGLNRGKVKEETIEIRTWIDKNLNITVSDRGIGFDVSEWRKNPKKTMEHTNIGICNVEEIIRLEYGDEYGLNIESEPGKGTVVTYVLPVLRKEGEHDSDNNSGR